MRRRVPLLPILIGFIPLLLALVVFAPRARATDVTDLPIAQTLTFPQLSAPVDVVRQRPCQGVPGQRHGVRCETEARFRGPRQRESTRLGRHPMDPIVLGQDGPALTTLNTLRARTDPVAPALAAVSDSVILRERLYELFGEAKRRQDLVRFGKFTNRTDAASGLVGGKVASADYYVLMPIPQTQISANPMLAQNPGY